MYYDDLNPREIYESSRQCLQEIPSTGKAQDHNQ